MNLFHTVGPVGPFIHKMTLISMIIGLETRIPTKARKGYDPSLYSSNRIFPQLHSIEFVEYFIY